MGLIWGTPAYMAPEQAMGKEVDRRADIWAFGVVLYEMLAGKRAYIGKDISEVLGAVLARDLDWEALPAETPGSLRSLLRDCLVRDPKQRLRDIGEARRVLDQLTMIAPGAPQLPPISTPSQQLHSRASAPSSVKARWWRWMAAVAVLVGIAGSLYWFLHREIPGALRQGGSGAKAFIQWSGGNDPVESGFEPWVGLLPTQGLAAQSRTGTGYDGWQIHAAFKDTQGYYFRRLRGAEKQAAYANGWVLRVRATPEDGMAVFGVEFGRGYRRFDVWLNRDSASHTVARLPVQLSPEVRYFEAYTLTAGDGPDDPEIELRFDHVTRLTDLYVGGQKRIGGYPGWDQYNLEDRGVFFGVFDFPRGHKGQATYRKVEFRSN